MSARHSISLSPRLLNQQQAAAYCGRCVVKFKTVCPVRPIDLGDGVLRYDRHALDHWIDQAGGGMPGPRDWLSELDDDGDGGARTGH